MHSCRHGRHREDERVCYLPPLPKNVRRAAGASSWRRLFFAKDVDGRSVNHARGSNSKELAGPMRASYHAMSFSPNIAFAPLASPRCGSMLPATLVPRASRRSRSIARPIAASAVSFERIACTNRRSLSGRSAHYRGQDRGARRSRRRRIDAARNCCRSSAGRSRGRYHRQNGFDRRTQGLQSHLQVSAGDRSPKIATFVSAGLTGVSHRRNRLLIIIGHPHRRPSGMGRTLCVRAVAAWGQRRLIR